MARQKILYIGNQLSQHKNATVTTLDTLSEHLQEEKYDVITASQKKNKWWRLFDMLWTVLKFQSSTNRVLIDTYSTQNFWYAVAVANLCRILQLPYIPILHGGNLPFRLEKWPLQSRKFFLGAKVNVAPSLYLMEAFKIAGYDNLVYIPNVLEINQYPFHLRESVSFKLLWVRSFSEIYNPMLALKMIERLQNVFPEVQLCMVGPDKDGSMEICKKYAAQKNLPVRFTGKLNKKEWIALSKAYDVFINTTNFDNMPVSVLEAMALGIPIVTTNVGGIPYLLQNRKEALCVPPNNVEAFVNALILLKQTSGMAKNMTLNARKKVENFDWEKVKELWKPLLED